MPESSDYRHCSSEYSITFCHQKVFGAGDRDRTDDIQIGNLAPENSSPGWPKIGEHFTTGQNKLQTGLRPRGKDSASRIFELGKLDVKRLAARRDAQAPGFTP
jgi:hypothetical protein